MKLAVVIPAYNEAKTIGDVISKVPRKIDGIQKVGVFVVSDASTDTTVATAHKAGAQVLQHRLNLGAGGASLTGITAARRQGYEAVVTLDGDGQHDPLEIHNLVETYQREQADLVIGSRYLSATFRDMPPVKKAGNILMNGITYVFSHQLVTDSQSGFRLFGYRFIEHLENFTTSGYEFCSETIMNARRLGMRIVEVPITTIYFADRRGQNPLNGVHIVLRLLYKTLTN